MLLGAMGCLTSAAASEISAGAVERKNVVCPLLFIQKVKLCRKVIVGLSMAFLTGCIFIVPPTKAFKETMDYYVGNRKPLSEYTRVYSPPTVAIQEIREVRPGVIEYFFEYGIGFHKPGKECKFVFIVEKDTEKIIGWRYNGDPDNCWIAS